MIWLLLPYIRMPENSPVSAVRSSSFSLSELPLSNVPNVFFTVAPAIMQLQALLVSALAATASAYRISVYSADSYQGTQRSWVSQHTLSPVHS